ncbi:CoA-acylating methylmalonate-semialdehyde dehydrogenase [Rhodospirillum rubrum]|uniref:methylmalonate-semialdehyde dehydrogenase (CoA acylating) n=1 Tax=Rhodospirillum rubrum (strain ATCC 11170 / ATH 1.1.1 / DSM 467 / LMG 4362 / NCIMB 8255 / S1) TaxID=269796 RepID=Q2RU53_RHORT|nr:CoA-acylating methylmalonate-semialdehyde dehydrogenase [Rhodospirillum rubrum]ABC22342.1 methylmalonate-semialdehyde dehydrogenase (acylating) [Rhodospirillum rubrum ATCC 11170]AEO48058.1 methylmalonate-semialdehyde dehydrogenase [Rhodospirillum rubrum F11]MBK5953922.1 methylmalonate-semialdehyde dehydrogenase (CoA acylating) [Rhodospirillum rubrum]QXG81981.1 CoA-acylating methylmalonate-semialdehyde dehydrogenase [Rhodospirillum rubrum]HAQ01524.1 methylmalonate-semialdehyde dehydrogenase 
MTLVTHFINGAATAPAAGRCQDIVNPASGAVIGRVELAAKATVEAAIAAAEAAFPAWRATPPAKRARVMVRFRQLLEDNADALCALITAEHGKALDDARGELGRGMENVDYACGIADLLKGERSANAGPGIDCWSEFQPLGVVAGITPFNFPAMVPLWMIPLAIACGNTFVLKPSERDPSAAFLLAEIALRAGVPPGVFNVVNGDKEAVDTLLTDPRVQAVGFVGSTPIAEYVYATGTAHGKRVQALGGAKNHALVLADADLDFTVNALMGAAFGSAGERCMAISVVLAVGDQLADALVAKLAAQLAGLKVAPGTEAGCEMGPLVSRAHADKVAGYVAKGVAEGAELVVDGRGLSIPGHEQGFFLGGCLFDRVTPAMTIYREEIFGPVLCVVRVASMEDGMALIDAHEFGNGTCLFTRDGEAARYFADHVKVGMVGINVPLPVPVATHSFGGWKRSLFGDLAAYGPDGVRFYTRRKTVSQRWPSSTVREGAQFAFPSMK